MFHLHVRYRSRDGGGSCAAARRYIARQGRYKKRGDKVRWVKSLHMPSWAGANSAPRYWTAAEGRHSRDNARTAILIELAIPKELTIEQQDELALAISEELASMVSKDRRISGKLPLTVAFHEGHGRNPHIHILLSTSIADGFVRDALTWFGRHNPKKPHAGGARRSKYVTERGWLYEVRQAWARVANVALERCGLRATLDHRSYATRVLTIEPQLHLGPSVAHMRRLGIETFRGKRFDEIERRRLEELELEADISRRRHAVQTLELQAMSLDQAQRDWQLEYDRRLRQLLEGHPLAGGAADRARQATALVVESDGRVAQCPGDAQLAGADVADFADAVGMSWIWIASKQVYWAVKPHQDAVVVLGGDFAATDADDEASIEAMIRSALLLPLARPKLVVQDWLRKLCVDVLLRLGLEWPVEGEIPQPSRRKFTP